MLKTFAKHFSCIVPILQSVSLCQHELRCCQNFFFPSQRRRKEKLAENRTSVARNRKTFKIKRFFFRRKPPFHALIALLLTSALSPSTFDQFSLPRSNFSSSTSFSFLPSLSLFLPPSSPPPPVEAVISLQLCSPAQTQQPCSWERRCRRCCCCSC